MRFTRRWLTVAGIAMGCLTSIANAQTTEPSGASEVPGLIVAPSDASVHDTATRFADQARTRGMTVFARVDHRQAAMSRSMALLPNEVVIFGDPKSGTPLMQCAPTAGIDLPMKALVWQDNAGQTWLGYNDPAWIAERHGAGDCDSVEALQRAVQELVDATLTEE
ncbi:DUF302 domain-containing protein [Salinicola avicenniae]|uniref:DUF302 domain-containing protein n=1 Tax=Salinicola avicenniae TaxID=2916836 RepID=UPI00207414E6|nr:MULTISPECIES: DUF302 domain-containing protein [unclassified Salinicola]